MSLFGNKKKEENNELPPLEFPELPKTVPAYEPGKMPEQREMERDAISPKDIPTQPTSMPSPGLPAMPAGPEQPLFIKIEKYRDVVDTLSKLKHRLGEAEHILNKLNRLKDEEDKELAAWHSDLTRIRNQLMDIDRKLFE